MSAAKAECPYCQTILPYPDVSHCPECGAPLRTSTTTPLVPAAHGGPETTDEIIASLRRAQDDREIATAERQREEADARARALQGFNEMMARLLSAIRERGTQPSHHLVLTTYSVQEPGILRRGKTTEHRKVIAGWQLPDVLRYLADDGRLYYFNKPLYDEPPELHGPLEPGDLHALDLGSITRQMAKLGVSLGVL